VRGDLPPHGRASEKTLTVRLPAAGMRRVAVNATPAQVHGAYLLTRGRVSFGITFACRLVPRLPQNFVCDGGDLRVRFSGPTG
jgi:hypothetical protein